MDAAGKDGAIRHVMSGVNPQGCQVFSFQRPSAMELEHDFLWRTNKALPDALLDKNTLWQGRYQSIADMEAHLHRNGTRVCKFFLHISKEEQRQRFLSRIDDPDKSWKFSLADSEERKFWDDYMRAYEACLSNTSTEDSPWYVVPADDKKNARLVIAQIIINTFKGLQMAYPKITPERRRELEQIRKTLFD